eukprot:142071-Pyramimonas_sp.AAC.1
MIILTLRLVAAPSKLLVRSASVYRGYYWQRELQQRETARFAPSAHLLENGSVCRHLGARSFIGAVTGEQGRPHRSQRQVATRGMAASAGPVAPAIVPELQPFFAWVSRRGLVPTYQCLKVYFAVLSLARLRENS